MPSPALRRIGWWSTSVGLLLVAALVVYLLQPAVRYKHLHELPGVSVDVLDAQGVMFRVEEPFPFSDSTGMASFEVEVLQTKGFGESRAFSFVGDAQSVQNFLNEVRLVNSGASRVSNLGRGAWDGITSLVSGLWHMLWHPIQTFWDLGAAVWGLVVYAWETPLPQMHSDISSLAEVVYTDWACKVAEGHGVNYLEVHIPQARSVVESDTNSQIVGRALTEMALLVVPLSKLEYLSQASKAGRVLEGSSVAAKTSKAGESGADAASLSRALRVTPGLVAKLELAGERGDRVRRTKVAVESAAKASSVTYRETFFAKHPDLRGKVVVHHAIEQQVLKRYPGVISEGEIHSLSNLRGIPKSANNDLHLSAIRREWNKFYRNNPPKTVTKEKLQQKAREIDENFGRKFDPPRTTP